MPTCLGGSPRYFAPLTLRWRFGPRNTAHKPARSGNLLLYAAARIRLIVAAENAGADAVATTLYGRTAETAGIRSFSRELLEEILELVESAGLYRGTYQSDR
jgi:hypothetical protein